MDRFYRPPEPVPVVEAPGVIAAVDRLDGAIHDLLRAIESLRTPPVVVPAPEVHIDTERLAGDDTVRSVEQAVRDLQQALRADPLRVHVTEPVGLDRATLGALEDVIKEVRRNTSTGQRVIAAGGSGGSKLPDLTGTWGYSAGVSGALDLSGQGKRILTITAFSSTGGTLTIDGGDAITVPASGSITIEPHVQLANPVLVFTNTTGYFVDWLTG